MTSMMGAHGMIAPLLLAGLVLAPPSDAAARLRAVIEKVRAQKSYATAFTAEIRVPNTNPQVLQGEGIWVAGGVLFAQYRASGGDHKRIVRVGDRTWVYHEAAEEWIAPERHGMSGAGHGIQNPDEILGVLLGHLPNVSLAGKRTFENRECDVFRVRMTGADIEKIMKEQAQQGAFDWARSSAEATALAGPDGLLYRIESSATLASSDPNLNGQTVGYSAEVNVRAYDRDFLMTFELVDPKTKATSAIPLDPDFYDAVGRRTGVASELAQALGRQKEARLSKLVGDLASKDFRVRESAEGELLLFGKAAEPALRKVLDDKERSTAVKRLLAEIEKR